MSIKSRKTKIIHNIFKTLFISLSLIAIYQITLVTFVTPRDDRNWTDESKILSSINFATSSVKIDNIKDFKYLNNDEKQYKANYYSDTFDFSKVKDVWFFQNDFAEPLGAHTFLTFEFEDDKYLSYSAEVRKEKGETYSPYNGLFRHYELHYVLVSEQDILTLRAGLRDEPVFMYKLNLDKNEKTNLFIDIMKRTDQINNNPEFYNTYDNSCTTNINGHLNAILSVNKKPGNSWEISFPKYADSFYYEKGLIDTGLTFEEIKQTSRINDRVRDAIKQNLNHLEFSKFIRQNYQETTRG